MLHVQVIERKKCKSEIIATHLGESRTCHISFGPVGLI